MTVLVNDPDFTLHVGDALQVLQSLPAESADCVVTSPPYWGLRDYGTGSWLGGDPDCDHVGVISFRDVCGKCGASRTDQQLGLEATPAAYVESMVGVFREVRRVLKVSGTVWLNLGDSYATSKDGNTNGLGASSLGAAGGESVRRATEAYGQRLSRASANRASTVPPGLKSKDLCGIPWRVAFALQEDGWYLRSDIIWAKPNPMPESVTDRPTKAHEYVFLLSKRPRYFFDAEAIREPVSPKSDFGNARPDRPYPSTTGDGVNDRRIHSRLGNGSSGSPSGRNSRSVWEIPTQPYPEAHFATFPMELARRCILAGTSERGVCPECGAPWERQTDVGYEPTTRTPAPNKGHIGAFQERAANMTRDGFVPNRDKQVTTTGWAPTCECHGWRYHWTELNADEEKTRHSVYVWPNQDEAIHAALALPPTVLDPFMGSGTVALVARQHGRRSIGIELSPEYAAMCARRLGQLSLLVEGA